MLLASIWFLSSCWAPHVDTVSKVKSLIKNYIWLGENKERHVKAKVEWDSLIQHQGQGRIKLIDTTVQMQALLTKLLVRGLMPSNSPWRVIIQHHMKSLQSKRGGKWPSHIHFILYTIRVRGNSSEIW